MPILLALASPASSIRLASDNARVIEERGIVLLAFLGAISNHFRPGTRLHRSNSEARPRNGVRRYLRLAMTSRRYWIGNISVPQLVAIVEILDENQPAAAREQVPANLTGIAL